MEGLREYKSFYKVVGGGERIRCRYNARLDSYGCGCAHDCGYCYAKSLLEFRDLWHPEDPAVADIRKIERVLDRIPNGTILRLGGMTDCFQPIERGRKLTYRTIRMLKRIGVHVSAVMVLSTWKIRLRKNEFQHVTVSS